MGSYRLVTLTEGIPRGDEAEGGKAMRSNHIKTRYWDGRRSSARMAVVLAALLGLSAALLANVQEIRPRPNNHWGRDRGQGEMNIRLRVDEEVDVIVRGDRILVRTLSGAWVQDLGSDYSAALPQREVAVQFSKRRGRGRAWLLEEPNRRNGFAARFRISDPMGGEGNYHIRLRYRVEGWGWESRSAADPATWGGGALRPSPAPVTAVAWRGPSWGRPSSWGRLPGRMLDPRRQERVRDIHGRNGGRFEFRGRIDEEVLFFIRGGEVTAQTQFGQRVQVERWSLDEPLPLGRRLRLQVSKRDGRGHVEILEEPNPSNRYTTVLRVSDWRGGSDRYHFRLDWRR